MSKVRVPLYGTTNRSVLVNPDASFGAQLGADLFDEDGNILTLDSLATQIGARLALGEEINDAIFEEQIVDGTILARLADDETVTGNWTFDQAIQFTPIAAPTHNEGLLWYDSSEKTLSFYNDEAEAVVHLGEDNITRCRNTTGAAITKGQVVYINGSTGANLPNIALAQANALATARVAGVAMHDIENNSNGYVMMRGILAGLNTAAFSAGDVLYLSTSVAGGLQNTRPTSDYAVVVGYCTISNIAVGEIKVGALTVQQANLTAFDDNETISGAWKFTNAAGLEIEHATDAILNFDSTTARLRLAGVNFLSSNAGTVNIGPGATTYLAVNSGGIDVTGDVDILAGNSLKIYDTTGVDSAEFSHNGTSFISTFTNTSEWELTGLTQFELISGNIRTSNGYVYAGDGVNTSFINYAGLYGDRLAMYVQNTHATGGIYIQSNQTVAVRDTAGTAKLSIRTDTDTLTSYVDNSISGGKFLRFYDSLNADYANFAHDGTDFNTTFIGTTDWNVSGITAIQAGTVDADFDAITATSYGGILEENLVDKTAVETISGLWTHTGGAGGTALQIQATTNWSAGTLYTPFLDFEQADGTNFARIRGYTSDGVNGYLQVVNPSDSSTVALMGPTIGLYKSTSIYSGSGLRLYDSTNADYANFAHDGTDFNTTFVGTTDWNISGITAIQAGTVDADFDAITATSYGGVLEANLLDKTAAETITGAWTFSNASLVHDAAGATTTLYVGNLASAGEKRIRLRNNQWTTGVDLVAGSGDSTYGFFNRDSSRWDLRLYTASALATFPGSVYAYAGGTLRLYDATNTDSMSFVHDGTNFTASAIGTTYWDWTSLTGLRVRDGATLSIYDSGDTDAVSLSHDGTDFTFTGSNTRAFRFTGGHIWLLGGNDLRIYDSTNIDSVAFTHDGTDFNIAGTTTTDINITGITAIQAGTVDADFDAITATSYGGITEANLLDKTAAETITGAWEFENAIRLADAATETNAMRILAEAAESVIETRYAKDLVFKWNITEKARLTTYGFGVTGGNALRIYDGTNTDYIQVSHDGTDVQIATVGTTDINFTGGAGVVFQAAANGTQNLYITEAGTGYVGAQLQYDGATNVFNIMTGNNPPVTRISIPRDSSTVSFAGQIAMENNTQLTMKDLGGTARYVAYVSTGDVLNLGSGNIQTQYIALSNHTWLTSSNSRMALLEGTPNRLSLQDGFYFRVQDAANTDYVDMYHDGTDFNFAGTNTVDVNFTGFTTDFVVGNYRFNANQTVGAGQDNYVLTYDNATGKIGLEAAAGGGSQTPWTSNIDAAEFDLLDVGTVRYAYTGATDYVDIGMDFANQLAFIPTGSADKVTLRDGLTLRIADAGDTDYADFSHDGTDFNTAFTNTTAWNITGASKVKISPMVQYAQGNPDDFYSENSHFIWFWPDNTTDTTTWMKVCDVTCYAGTYSGLAMTITVRVSNSNYGSTADIEESTYTAAFHRSAAVLDDQDTAVLYGFNPGATQLRIIKTATGVYELQALNTATYDSVQIEVLTHGTNGGTVTPATTVAAGSTVGTVYSATYPPQSLSGPVSWQPYTITSGLRILDSALTDYMEMYHNGTDLSLGFVNTTALRVNSGVMLRVYDSTNGDYFQLRHDGSNATLVTGGTDGNDIYFQPEGATKARIGVTDTDFRTAVKFYDSGVTDYLQIAHDGTDVNFTVVNTAEINWPTTIAHNFSSSIVYGVTELRCVAGNGYGLSFWNSSRPYLYGIWMSQAGDATYGGRTNIDTTSDYNMYFNMESGTNRGFVFQYNDAPYFSIQPNAICTETDFYAYDNIEIRPTTSWTAGNLFTPGILFKEADGTISMPYIQGYTYDGVDGYIGIYNNDASTSILFGKTNYSYKDFNIMSGRFLRIRDATSSDYVEISHDGTDLNTTFSGTTCWNINLNQVLIGHTTPGVNQRTLTVYDDASTGVPVAFESNSASYTLVDLDNTNAAPSYGAQVRFLIAGTAKATFGYQAAYSTTAHLGVMSGHTASPYHVFYAQGSGYYMRGGDFRQYNSGLTDYANFAHDGTDYNTTFVNTADWNIAATVVIAVDNTTATGQVSAIQMDDHNGQLRYAGFMDSYNARTNTSFTLSAADAGNVAHYTDGSSYNVTLPSSTDYDFPVGCRMDIINRAAGTININVDAGATVTLYWTGSGGSAFSTGNRDLTYGWATIWRQSNTVFYITGNGIT